MPIQGATNLIIWVHWTALAILWLQIERSSEFLAYLDRCHRDLSDKPIVTQHCELLARPRDVWKRPSFPRTQTHGPLLMSSRIPLFFYSTIFTKTKYFSAFQQMHWLFLSFFNRSACCNCFFPTLFFPSAFTTSFTVSVCTSSYARTPRVVSTTEALQLHQAMVECNFSFINAHLLPNCFTKFTLFNQISVSPKPIESLQTNVLRASLLHLWATIISWSTLMT